MSYTDHVNRHRSCYALLLPKLGQLFSLRIRLKIALALGIVTSKTLKRRTCVGVSKHAEGVDLFSYVNTFSRIGLMLKYSKN